MKFRDFEDAVQYAGAIAYGVDAIVTRDVSGKIPKQEISNLQDVLADLVCVNAANHAHQAVDGHSAHL